jgi:uncharacterized protein YsxB (DUF464 family)
MICAEMLMRNGTLCGFDVQGHSGSAVSGRDIVCAAVSSATYMAANTLTEVCGCQADITEADGRLRVVVAETDKAQEVLKGLHIHLQGLVAQYPKFITIQLTEV